ncbi:DUF2892 domain-containing protein [Novosphingobium sp. KCTC 2891]|uniref:YgaP family membrane protein n=1 Tax=Novosphingobium sp. KCTC 2891 TaxID=2989730 RepID=UPI0039B4C41F
MANVGQIDRINRIVLGLVLIILALVVPGATWAWLGLVPLVTGLVGYCPLYRLLHIDHRLHH